MPASLSVGLPLFVFLGPAILTLLIPDQEFVEIWIESERGLVENLTTVLAIIGVVVALVAVRRSAQVPNRLLTVWLVLFALGFLYIATEETSLGQHWIPWKTPDWLADVNRYGEANLHNVSTTIDRIPKTIVGLVVVLAGVGWPLYRRWRGIVLGGATDWRRWFLPTDGTLLLAAFFLSAWLIDRTLVALDMERSGGDGFSHQEHRELLMVTFLFLYTVSITRRLRTPQLTAGLAQPDLGGWPADAKQ
jgi:hypothetical protein